MLVSSTTALIIFIVSIVLAVIISQKINLNLGLVGLAFAFVLGGCLGGMSATTIMAQFPTNLFFTQFVVTLFFAYAIQTGVFKALIDRIVYKTHGATWALPLALLASGLIVGAMGAGADATPVIFSPIAFTMAATLGFDPLLAAIIVYIPSCWTGILPWTSVGVVFRGIVANTFGEETAYTIMNICIVTVISCFAILFAIYYFKLKGYKIDKARIDSFPEPAPFTRDQKISIGIVLTALAVLLLPNIVNTLFPNTLCAFIVAHFEIRTVSILGVVAFHVFRIGDPVDALRNKVPWGVLFMVGGMCTFINTGVHMGIIDVVAQFIGDTIPGRWMPLALSVIASLMSFVVTGPGVIYPLFMPMVPVLAEVSGANPLLCAAALVCGVLPTGMCPLSQGGASAQLGATDEVRQKIFWPQTRAAALDAIIFAVLAAAGWYTVIGKLFGVA